MRDHEGGGFLGFAGDLYRELGVHRPELCGLVDQYANASCLDYGARFFRSDQGLSPVLVDALHSHAARLHGEDVAQAVAAGARECSSVATGEHAALLGDVMQFQSALMLSAGARTMGVPAVISVPFGNVPLDNTSTRSGSVLWKGRAYRWISNRRDARRALAYGSQPIARDTLTQRFRDHDLRHIEHMFPAEMFRSDLRYLTDQFAVANRVLWTHTLGGLPEFAPFVQIPSEELVATLVADSFSRRDVFYDMIFDSRCRSAYLEEFQNIRSCHRAPPRPRPFGTLFFWGRSERSGRQLHYFLESPESKVLHPFVSVHGEMRPPGGKHAAPSISLEPGQEHDILERLERRTLVPSVFLSLALLASHGATNNGGYQQTDYFRRVKRAMLAYLERNARFPDARARSQQLERWSAVDTGGFCLGPIFLLKPGGNRDSQDEDNAASLDALWHLTESERCEEVLGALQRVTFCQAVLAGATRFYASIVQDAPYHVPELLNLRVEHVLGGTRARMRRN